MVSGCVVWVIYVLVIGVGGVLIVVGVDSVLVRLIVLVGGVNIGIEVGVVNYLVLSNEGVFVVVFEVILVIGYDLVLFGGVEGLWKVYFMFR